MPANSIPAMIVNILIWVIILAIIWFIYKWYNEKKIEAMFKKGDDKHG